MKPTEPNHFLLIGYMEEALPAEQMSKIEEMLRQSDGWRKALAEIQGDIDHGEHSVAQIWRRRRLTCLSRERLGAFLVDALPPDEADYIEFHLNTIKCRWCQANFNDLKETQADSEPPRVRRKKIFKTSVGHLPKKK
jgi:hypothetical protein